MLAVDGGLLGDHAGGQPQPETEEMAGQRMQVQRTMRLMAVQKNGDRGNGDVRQHQCDDDIPHHGRSSKPLSQNMRADNLEMGNPPF
jgi:hypothetical protein